MSSVEPIFVDVTNKVSVDAPLSLYLALRERRYPYLLESVEKSGQKARFSFVGADPSAVITVKNRYVTMEFFCGEMTPTEEKLSKCVHLEQIGSILTGARCLPTFIGDQHHHPPFLGEDDVARRVFATSRLALPCRRRDGFKRDDFPGADQVWPLVGEGWSRCGQRHQQCNLP